MPLKMIMSKCVMDWQIFDEVSIVEMGNGFSLVKSTNAIDFNRAL